MHTQYGMQSEQRIQEGLALVREFGTQLTVRVYSLVVAFYLIGR